VEQAAAQIGADPESREPIADMAERLPAKADMNRPTAWAVLILVGGVLMAAAPDIPPNDIMMLARTAQRQALLPCRRISSSAAAATRYRSRERCSSN